MLSALILGWMQLTNLRRETFPDFTPSELQIGIAYPGASAEEIEQAICQRVEDAIDGVSDIREVRSDAREGLATIDVEMSENGNFQRFMDDVRRAIDAIDDFPDEAEDPVITEKYRTDMVLAILVSGPMDAPSLKAHCENIKDRMKDFGLSLIEIQGFPDHQLRVELNVDSLLQYGLSAKSVADIIRAQNVDLPAGAIETQERDILIRFEEQRTTPTELGSLVILAQPNGAKVRLKELATIVDLFEVPENKIEVKGLRAGVLQIKKTKQQDTIRVAKLARTFIDQEQKRHPQVQLTIIQDMSVVLQDRLNMLIKNVWQGLLLVFFTLWLFFSLRVSFWVTMGLPVAFLGGFYFMPMAGLTINMLTMVGLLIALGLIMDDAIVIAENIVAHRERGANALQSAVKGTIEVFPGVVSSFITTACVLLPLFYVTGEIGKVLRVMPKILMLVLAVSLIEAFFILPNHLAHALGGHLGHSGSDGDKFKKPRRMRQRIERILGYIKSLYGRSIECLLKWRYLVLGTTLGLFIISLAMVTSGRLKLISFPELEGNIIVARLLLPQGTPLDRTEAAVTQLTTALERVNDKFSLLQPKGESLVKNTFVQYSVNSDAFETGPHLATVNVDLLKAEKRRGKIDDYLSMWREETGIIPDVIALSFTEPTLGPGGRSIEIRLRGHDLNELKRATETMRQWFGRFPGVFNLADDLRPGKPELVLTLKEGARNMGLSASDIAQQVRSAYQGSVVIEMQVDGESYELDVRLNAAAQNTSADLTHFQITLSDGTLIPLTAAVNITKQRGWGRISRINGQRTVTLRGDTDIRKINTRELLARFTDELLPILKASHPGIRISMTGEIEEANKTIGSMLSGLLIGLMGIFGLLSFQFRSYIEPITVMLAVPMALIGVVWGHVIMMYPISLTSMFGFVALAGIVVNDSLLLIVFLKKRRKQLVMQYSESRKALAIATVDAAAQAGRLRFRAVILTSSTTIAGLTPLLFERSLQAQVLIPMVISIVYGLLASTVLVLLVIPCFFAVLNDLNLIPEPYEGVEDMEDAEKADYQHIEDRKHHPTRNFNPDAPEEVPSS
jgi:multidrug efflux pump subunit AcrB